VTSRNLNSNSLHDFLTILLLRKSLFFAGGCVASEKVNFEKKKKGRNCAITNNNKHAKIGCPMQRPHMQS
jgi:hypothetical protein